LGQGHPDLVGKLFPFVHFAGIFGRGLALDERADIFAEELFFLAEIEAQISRLSNCAAIARSGMTYLLP
jgi:hypothetical protein